MGNARSFRRMLLRKQKPKSSKGALRVSHRVVPARVIAPKALLPMKRAPAFFRKTAAVVAASLIAFSPVKSRAVDSREPPPNSASFADFGKGKGFVTYKRSWGVERAPFGFDSVRTGFSPKLFGVTNSGPVFVYDHFFARTKVENIRVGVAQKFSLSKNAVLKLGVFTPDLNLPLNARDARFGVIFSKGLFSADYFDRGVVAGRVSQGGGASIGVGKGVSFGVGFGSPGYTSPNASVRLGVKLADVEPLLGLSKGALFSPAIDFGVTSQRHLPKEIDVGILFSPNKNVKFGFDFYDLNSRIGGKSGAKVAGLVIFNF